jgi:hypothetical protein
MLFKILLETLLKSICGIEMQSKNMLIKIYWKTKETKLPTRQLTSASVKINKLLHKKMRLTLMSAQITMKIKKTLLFWDFALLLQLS